MSAVACRAGLVKVALWVTGGVGALAGSGLVRVEMRNAVRLTWLQSPPGNLFGPDLCAALLAALHDARADAGTRSVVLISALNGPGQGFSGGVDLADMGRAWPADVPSPADIVRSILDAPWPVIAALHGPVLGAGAEIALAAQARVAVPDLRFGLRDALVGRLPMAGATQTLPRLIGAVEAFRLIGKAVTASAVEALAMGIVDRVTEGDLLTAALEMAAAPPAAGRAPGLRDGRSFQTAIAKARDDLAAINAVAADPVGAALVDCVEAAQLLPLTQGLHFEAEAAADIAARPAAAALQHLMAADMRMVVDLAGGRAVPQIGLWGAACWPLIGPALRAGIEVVLADDDRAALLQAVERVALAQEEQVVAGRLTAQARDLEWARLRPAVHAADLHALPLVFAAKPGANGQVIMLGGGGDGTADLPRLHLIAPSVGELQVLPGQHSLGVVAAATLRKMRIRVAVTQAASAAGCARVMVAAARGAVAALIRQGVLRATIATALTGVMRLPFPTETETAIATGNTAKAGPVVMPAETIRARILGAVAAEGGRLLMQGAVQRAATLDALAVVALGMPRASGGPLFAADQRGLLLLRRDLATWQHDHPVWAPPALLDHLLSQGKRLSNFDADRHP